MVVGFDARLDLWLLAQTAGQSAFWIVSEMHFVLWLPQLNCTACTTVCTPDLEICQPACVCLLLVCTFARFFFSDCISRHILQVTEFWHKQGRSITNFRFQFTSEKPENYTQFLPCTPSKISVLSVAISANGTAKLRAQVHVASLLLHNLHACPTIGLDAVTRLAWWQKLHPHDETHKQDKLHTRQCSQPFLHCAVDQKHCRADSCDLPHAHIVTMQLSQSTRNQHDTYLT